MDSYASRRMTMLPPRQEDAHRAAKRARYAKKPRQHFETEEQLFRSKCKLEIDAYYCRDDRQAISYNLTKQWFLAAEDDKEARDAAIALLKMRKGL